MAGTNNIDLSGNNLTVSSLQINSDTPFTIGATAPQILAGSGVPTLSAKKGSLYINVTASTTTTRLYINTDGATTWTTFTTAA